MFSKMEYILADDADVYDDLLCRSHINTYFDYISAMKWLRIQPLDGAHDNSEATIMTQITERTSIFTCKCDVFTENMVVGMK